MRKPLSGVRATHIDIGFGEPLCGADVLGPALTSDEEASIKPCKRCQKKLERLIQAVRGANTVPKLLRAQLDIRDEFGDQRPGSTDSNP
jgi:hypothetical protein